MLNRKILLSLLLLSASSLSFAENISEEDIKKAIEGITQIRVMEASEPKIVSETIITEEVATQTKQKKNSRKKLIKKKSTKKSSRKKIYKKKEVTIDLSELKDVETLGVISTSQPFELKN